MYMCAFMYLTKTIELFSLVCNKVGFKLVRITDQRTDGTAIDPDMGLCFTKKFAIVLDIPEGDFTLLCCNASLNVSVADGRSGLGDLDSIRRCLESHFFVAQECAGQVVTDLVCLGDSHTQTAGNNLSGRTLRVVCVSFY